MPSGGFDPVLTQVLILPLHRSEPPPGRVGGRREPFGVADVPRWR